MFGLLHVCSFYHCPGLLACFKSTGALKKQQQKNQKKKTL